jgi:hypothetical protein
MALISPHGLKFLPFFPNHNLVFGRVLHNTIDFKATEVKDQKEADKKTRDSLQMDLYALSFARTQDVPPLETRFIFWNQISSAMPRKKRRRWKEL